MNRVIPRRQLLATGLAGAFLPAAARTASAGAQRLVAGTRIIEVNGRPARVFGLTGPDGRSGIRLAPGERFHVELANQTGTPTLIHWHGQLPPWIQDGFPWPQTPPIGNGARQTYDYAPVPGTYWMHSHHALQEQRLMAAPLIVHDAATLGEDRQEIILMLQDFTFRTPEEVLAGLTGGDPGDRAMSMMSGPGMQPMAMAGMGPSMPAASGPSPMRMDLNDTPYDAFLANERTLADPQVVPVERGGRIRIRVINGASSSQFWIELGDLTGRVVATDGHPTQPVAGSRFPIAMAQRLDILIDLPRAGGFPILARLEGSARQTGIILATAGTAIPRIGENTRMAPPLDHSLETRLAAVTPLLSRQADLVRTVYLGGGMSPYAWSMNGETWPRTAPLLLDRGQRVEIELVNHSMMAHPMHLHGHAFQVVALDGERIQGAVRDTVLVPPMMRSVRIAFDADNPGRWALHCHNLYHMATGMMTEVRYRGIGV